MSSPKVIVHKLKQRPFRVLVLGQAGVGKTALTVRFITRRFIGEYDPTLADDMMDTMAVVERKYYTQTEVDDESIAMEILDTAAQDPQADSLHLDEHIRWADAYLLVFCVTDHCSLDHLTHLRFHINHKAREAAAKPKPWRSSLVREHNTVPVLLVGNKNDLSGQRMVPESEGRRRAEELECADYKDISVRESYEDANDVFQALYRVWKNSNGSSSKSSSGNSNSSSRKVLQRQDQLRVSPPSPRRRSHRSSLFRSSHSSSTDSDTAQVPSTPRESAETTSSGPFLEVHSPVKRKPSVHKRILRILPNTFKVSRESGDENSGH